MNYPKSTTAVGYDNTMASAKHGGFNEQAAEVTKDVSELQRVARHLQHRVDELHAVAGELENRLHTVTATAPPEAISKGGLQEVYVCPLGQDLSDTLRSAEQLQVRLNSLVVRLQT